jgi:hypothetical protein
MQEMSERPVVIELYPQIVERSPHLKPLTADSQET